MLRPVALALVVACGPSVTGSPPGSTPTSTPSGFTLATQAPRPPVASATPTSGAPATARRTTDQTDELDGYQVHFLYVLPSDGIDDQLDTNGVLEGSVAAMQDWFVSQTGGLRIAIDTYGGRPDITFVRVDRSDSEIRAFGDRFRTALLAELAPRGFDHPRKAYVAYYGGGSDVACGYGGWPLAVVALRGGRGQCDRVRAFLDLKDERARAANLGLLHEVLHIAGLVARCAPHHDPQSPSHVTDDPSDLMHAMSFSLKPLPIKLDAGNDDYFRHGRIGCPDLMQSALIRPTPPNAVVPPGAR